MHEMIANIATGTSIIMVGGFFMGRLHQRVKAVECRICPIAPINERIVSLESQMKMYCDDQVIVKVELASIKTELSAIRTDLDRRAIEQAEITKSLITTIQGMTK